MPLTYAHVHQQRTESRAATVVFPCQVRSGGPAIYDETQRVTAIIDIAGSSVVEPSKSSASGHLQSKLSRCPYCQLGPFHGKSSQVEKNKISNSAMKTSIYYFALLI